MRDPFTYIPPNDVTAPKYAAIRVAHVHAVAVCRDAVADDCDPAQRYKAVNDATKAFHDCVESTCPPSADTSAAYRCVRLARMAANEAIRLTAADRLAAGEQPGALHVPDLDIDENLRRCLDNLIAARWQACAAIALADP